jgi:preprotein translocase subunit SecA
MDDLTERTEASLKKFKERADQLREDLGDARAATKVQMKAMIQRLDAKYEEAEKELDRLKSSQAAGKKEDIRKLHDEIVDDLQSMVKTIRRRIR